MGEELGFGDSLVFVQRVTDGLRCATGLIPTRVAPPSRLMIFPRFFAKFNDWERL